MLSVFKFVSGKKVFAGLMSYAQALAYVAATTSPLFIVHDTLEMFDGVYSRKGLVEQLENLVLPLAEEV